jgi:acetyl esterase/lipase
MPPVLEPAAQAFADAASKPPFVYDLGPAAARRRLRELQASPPAGDGWVDADGVRVRIVRPRDAVLPVALFLHGGGWMLGDAGTHHRLVRELAIGADAAIAFVEYDRTPEARYPVALEQAYTAARWIVREGASHDLDASRLAVLGDSSGGNLAAALTLLARERGDVRFIHQQLYYPATDAAMDTESYAEFAHATHVSAQAMAWFWEAYAPREEVTASPLRARLEGLPPALVIVAEVDVLRDEGEAYAAKLRAAGVRVATVRYGGTIHDFMLLRPLAQTAATRAAVAQAIAALRDAFYASA